MLFPSREFGKQEYEDNAEILAFATKSGFKDGEYGHLFALGNIKGKNARPLWRYLYASTNTGPPIWNFKGKYLVDRSGVPHKVKDLEAQIQAMLEEEPGAAPAAPAAPAGDAAVPSKSGL